LADNRIAHSRQRSASTGTAKVSGGERPGFSFYFPFMTSLIVSVVLSVLLWLVNR
jgi:hypothetical protein